MPVIKFSAVYLDQTCTVSINRRYLVVRFKNGMSFCADYSGRSAVN